MNRRLCLLWLLVSSAGCITRKQVKITADMFKVREMKRNYEEEPQSLQAFQSTMQRSSNYRQYHNPAQSWLNRGELLDLLSTARPSDEWLLLFCPQSAASLLYSKCHDIPKWVHEYTQVDPKWSNLRFAVTKSLSVGQQRFGVAPETVPMLIYNAANSTIFYPSTSTMRKTQLNKWLQRIQLRKSKQYTLTNFQQLLTESATTVTPRPTNYKDYEFAVKHYQLGPGKTRIIFVEVNCNKRNQTTTKSSSATVRCLPVWWPLMARTVLDMDPFEIGHISVAADQLDEYSVLFDRHMPNVTLFADESDFSQRYCLIFYLNPVKHTYYRFNYSKGVSPRRIRRQVREPRDEAIYTVRAMTDIERQFYLNERKSQQRVTNKVNFVVGGMCGLAVMALAVTIFWGLNSSSFAEKESRRLMDHWK